MSSSRGAMLARSGVLQPAGRAAARRRGGRGSADESATAILAVRGFTQIVPWEASSRGPYGRGYADLLSKRQIVHKDLLHRAGCSYICSVSHGLAAASGEMRLFPPRARTESGASANSARQRKFGRCAGDALCDSRYTVRKSTHWADRVVRVSGNTQPHRERDNACLRAKGTS